MTFEEKINHFLQTDHLVCDNDGKPLQWGYQKLAMWPQYPMLSWRWFKQLFAGNVRVLRFHSDQCFIEFCQKGRLVEMKR